MHEPLRLSGDHCRCSAGDGRCGSGSGSVRVLGCARRVGLPRQLEFRALDRMSTLKVFISGSSFLCGVDGRLTSLISGILQSTIGEQDYCCLLSLLASLLSRRKTVFDVPHRRSGGSFQALRSSVKMQRDDVRDGSAAHSLSLRLESCVQLSNASECGWASEANKITKDCRPG
jgi:hypothetical protein